MIASSILLVASGRRERVAVPAAAFPPASLPGDRMAAAISRWFVASCRTSNMDDWRSNRQPVPGSQVTSGSRLLSHWRMASVGDARPRRIRAVGEPGKRPIRAELARRWCW